MKNLNKLQYIELLKKKANYKKNVSLKLIPASWDIFDANPESWDFIKPL
jgi:hypothetical protein